MSFPMKFSTIIATKYIMLSTEISVILINKVSFIDIGVTDDELLISFHNCPSAITDKYNYYIVIIPNKIENIKCSIAIFIFSLRS